MKNSTPNFYDRVVAPHVVHCLCSMRPIDGQRAQIVPHATGTVLEIGMGSGLNLPHYDTRHVDRIIGVEPDTSMLDLGTDRRDQCRCKIDVINGSAESIPLEDATIDSAVITYTLCTVPNAEAALAEVRRVLKPNGRILVCEHGRSSHATTARWQDRLNKPWQRLALGCNLNRDTAELIQAAGFRFDSFDKFVLSPFPGLLGTHTLGIGQIR